MTTSKPPTPRGISRLLASAGFERSNYGGKGVMWSEASDGFSVWKSHHQNAPQQPFVAVQHVIKDTSPRYDDWPERKHEMLTRLGEYAAVIRAAGWPALVRDRGRDEPPWLTILTVVTAGKADQ